MSPEFPMVTERATHDRASLREDLRNLGLRDGDLVFAHSSFKSLGPVEGGAETVIATLEDAVGEEGLVLMPSFNLAPERARRHEVWNRASTPSSVGWITEVFRTFPGTHRSDHYSHSVAARVHGVRSCTRSRSRRARLTRSGSKLRRRSLAGGEDLVVVSVPYT